MELREYPLVLWSIMEMYPSYSYSLARALLGKIPKQSSAASITDSSFFKCFFIQFSFVVKYKKAPAGLRKNLKPTGADTEIIVLRRFSSDGVFSLELLSLAIPSG